LNGIGEWETNKKKFLNTQWYANITTTGFSQDNIKKERIERTNSNKIATVWACVD
jgi:hypothetical protein